jgi:hypothetical protein
MNDLVVINLSGGMKLQIRGRMNFSLIKLKLTYTLYFNLMYVKKTNKY